MSSQVCHQEKLQLTNMEKKKFHFYILCTSPESRKNSEICSSRNHSQRCEVPFFPGHHRQNILISFPLRPQFCVLSLHSRTRHSWALSRHWELGRLSLESHGPQICLQGKMSLSLLARFLLEYLLHRECSRPSWTPVPAVRFPRARQISDGPWWPAVLLCASSA